jgi:hypothetical protein
MLQDFIKREQEYAAIQAAKKESDEKIIAIQIQAIAWLIREGFYKS